MAFNFDKQYVKEQIALDDIYAILHELDAEPQYNETGLRCKTICHQLPEQTDKLKLYYYEANQMFYCYSGGCAEPSFDIFDLIIKVYAIQKKRELGLNDAVRLLAYRFGIIEYLVEEEKSRLEDWDVLGRYARIKEIEIKNYDIQLKEYDRIILSRFNYNVRIEPWLKEHIPQEILNEAQIGFYAGADQITIPHFDKDNRFIGLRGRALSTEEAEQFGKYKPLKINNILYSHPLGMNLYNLNRTKDNIQKIGKAIIVESEKSALQIRGYLGVENDISVACCGSSISAYQMNMLLEAGAKEVIVAFDRDFLTLGDEDCRKVEKHLTAINQKFKNDVLVSFMFDNKNLLGFKDSPSDCGRDTFLQLFKERVVL